jgi:hypothetical protein
MPRSIWILAAALPIVATAACDENLSTIAGPTPNLEPTFTSIQQEIFENSDSSGRFTCVRCHTAVGRTPAAGLNLERATAYDQLVNVASRVPGLMRVQPGDPENSYLIHKLEGRPTIVGGRMPLNSPAFLTDGQVTIIRRWIQNGASRN